MTMYFEKKFKSRNNGCIVDALFVEGENKVRDHEYRGFAHWDCKTNLKLAKNSSCDIS